MISNRSRGFNMYFMNSKALLQSSRGRNKHNLHIGRKATNYIHFFFFKETHTRVFGPHVLIDETWIHNAYLHKEHILFIQKKKKQLITIQSFMSITLTMWDKISSSLNFLQKRVRRASFATLNIINWVFKHIFKILKLYNINAYL